MFEVKDFDVAKFDSILARGLSIGIGEPGKQVCIEAAICETLGLGFSDDPKCVSTTVRDFKITLNDSSWTTPEARAKGLHDLGLAQLGSKDVIEDIKFTSKLSEKLIRKLIPALFREIFPEDERCLKAADRCEKEGSREAAKEAATAAWDAPSQPFGFNRGAEQASTACEAASYGLGYGNGGTLAMIARRADMAQKIAFVSLDDKYLRMAADLALEVLKELNSPGVQLLN